MDQQGDEGAAEDVIGKSVERFKVEDGGGDAEEEGGEGAKVG